MICPYRKEIIINDKGGYKEVWSPCAERECPYYSLVLNRCCEKAEMEIKKWASEVVE